MRACPTCGAENPDGALYCNACGASIASTPSTGASRRPVTVVFCDLVESTALTARLDPESIRTVLRRHLDGIRVIVERHGGTIEKFIGDAAMAVFGVPHVHEDDPLRAVRAAADMRESLAALNQELERDWDVVLETRTGIASGEVVVGDASAGHAFVTGGVVNLAARLEQAAARGEILLSFETHRLVRDAVAVEPVGPLSLKGFGDDLVAHRLLDVSPSAPGHARRFDSPLVDRERERALLQQTFERVASDRRCQLFTVLGPPGIGKSRLVEEFDREAQERGRVLRGRCLSYGEGITFWPIAEVVRQAAGLTDADPHHLAHDKIAAVLSGHGQAPVIAERVGEAIGLTAGSAAPEETLWAIRLFFEGLASDRPLILVFDDIHWAEPKLLELIEHVADWSRDAPIMLLCLARPELLEARPGWGGGKVNATTILLDTLRPEETDTLVLNLLRGTELSPDVRDRIVQTAGGYPLFAEEIVSMLIDDELLVRDEGDAWIAAPGLAEISLPQTIAALLAARLDRLSAGERMTIERASVIGRDFSAAEISALTPAAERADVQDHLWSLVRKDLVRSVRSDLPGHEAFRFRHLLTRDACYNQMSKAARADLHERYADWLVDREDRPIEGYEEIVGYHLEEAHRLRSEVSPAGAHLDELARRAGEHLSASGRRAFERGDLPAATNLLRRSVALLPPSHSAYLATLADLHDTLFQSGAMQDASVVLKDLADRASLAGDEELVARAELDQLWLEFATSPLIRSVQELGRAVDASVERLEQRGDERNLAWALELLATVQWCSGDAGAMLRQSERALALARKVGNRRYVASTAAYVAAALLLGETPCSDALVRLEDLMQELTDDPVAAAAVGLHLGLLHALGGRFDRARAQVAASTEVFRDLGQRRWLADAMAKSGLIARLEGRLDDAEREFRESYGSFEEQRDSANAPTSACELGEVLCELQRYDDASALSRYAESAAVSHDLEPQVGWRCVRARALAGLGSPDEGERFAREALDLVAPTDFLGLHADVLLNLGEVLLAAGRNDEAATALTGAIERYERKGNLVGAQRAATLRSRHA